MPNHRKSQKQEIPSSAKYPRLTVTEAGMRIVRQLVGRPPLRVTDLMAVLNVTRTAISEQLNELISAGYVSQTQERCDGRGRPRYLFSVTELAMRNLFEGPRDIVCPAIWQSILQRTDPEAAESIRRDVAKTLADFYNDQLFESSPKKRLKEFVFLLHRQGRIAELTESGTIVKINTLSCPFFSMVEDTGSICMIHLSALQMILGNEVTVRRVAHRDQDTHPCCIFQIEWVKKNNDYPDRGRDI